jgi:uncharacterized protein
MKKLTLEIILILVLLNCTVYSQPKTTEFSFSFENRKYSGLIDQPSSGTPKSTIILIPGSGRTFFVERNAYYELRTFLANQGFAVCTWDKAGCGKSEGTFDNQQPVQNSADEALAAIKEIRHQKISGSGKIGLWGISRGGWICPLIIEKDASISFWISVSGVDAFDNFRYLLETNLKIEGRTDQELKLLMDEFDFCTRHLRGGKTYEEFIAGTKNLFNDPYCKSMGMGLSNEKEFIEIQSYYQKSGFVYDELTGLQIFVPNFEQTMLKVHCPVLAIFGENDTQVNWRQTKALYERTIGKNNPENLTIKTLPNCNHNILTCKTGGFKENLNQPGLGQPCDGYYDSMKLWLQQQGLASKK